MPLFQRHNIMKKVDKVFVDLKKKKWVQPIVDGALPGLEIRK